MSVSWVSNSMENHNKNPQLSTSPGSHPRHNRKRRNRSHTSVEDDSFHSDTFGPNAFWQNYQKAFRWGNNQEVAYWRSRVVALEIENKMLRQHISRLSVNGKDSIPPPMCSPPEMHHALFNADQSRPYVNTHGKRKKKRKHKKRKSAVAPVEEVSDSQLEFEVTDEMKDFFELHMIHKMEQEKKHLEDKKKSEEAANDAGEENAKLISHPINFSARADELKLLYGDASPMIHGMETAVQLSFRRHCEKTGARLWPNIPLRC